MLCRCLESTEDARFGLLVIAESMRCALTLGGGKARIHKGIVLARYAALLRIATGKLLSFMSSTVIIN